MNEKTIGLVDYGMGNLHSVAKALELAGANVVVSNSVKKLSGSEALVVPGVGAFGAAMKELAHRKLDDFIRKWFEEDKPYLGICLGLQVLFEKSEESPGTSGLGIIKGKVKKFRQTNGKKIPHMGWNQVKINASQKNTLFKGIPDNSYFYFVHSYYPAPENAAYVAGITNYGENFCSAIGGVNFIATQFHPEKSGKLGLLFLRNFARTVVAGFSLRSCKNAG